MDGFKSIGEKPLTSGMDSHHRNDRIFPSMWQMQVCPAAAKWSCVVSGKPVIDPLQAGGCGRLIKCFSRWHLKEREIATLPKTQQPLSFIN